MPLYRILRSHPLTEKTGEIGFEDGRSVKWHRVTKWPVLGTIEARSEEQALSAARQRFGGRPVIERAEEIHYV